MDHALQATVEAFLHRPLDHSTQSIRLVEISPDLSAKSLIQCTMRTTTIDVRYICLSYRWGDASSNQQILINNRSFVVRQNLFDFLIMIRGTQKSLPLYWIDALCIDQTNNAERNHQVAQMGDIFAGALTVHLWLGRNQALVPALQILQKDAKNTTFAEWAFVRSSHSALQGFICNNEYWNRAWIIQEIFLAQAVLVWADEVLLEFEKLHWTLDYFNLGFRNSLITQFKPIERSTSYAWSQMLTFTEAKRAYYGVSLVSLLAQFPNKSCELPRDRIFSLLSICGEGRQVPVNYSNSDAQVALDVLQCCCEAIHCLCIPLLVIHCLKLVEFDQDQVVEPYLEVDIPCLRLSPPLRHSILYAGAEPIWYLEGQRTVFVANDRYYEVHDVQYARDTKSSCSSLEKLRNLLNQLRYINEIHKIQYQELGNKDCFSKVTDEVKCRLLQGTSLCVREATTKPGTHVFMLVKGINLERRNHWKPWMVHISFGAFREALSSAEQLSDHACELRGMRYVSYDKKIRDSSGMRTV